MVRKMLLLVVAAALLAGFTPPASAADSSSSDEHDYSYVWRVDCNCEWDFRLVFYHHGEKVHPPYYDTCKKHDPIYQYIKAPDYGRKITLYSELDYPGFESETEDTEKYFNGRFTVYHKISDTCWFSSTVEERKH